jgi:hypothetical protein
MFLRFVQVLAYNTLCIFMLQLTWACVLLAVLCHTRGTLVWSALQICQDGLTFEIRQDLYHWKLALVVEMLDRHAPSISAPRNTLQRAYYSFHCE